MTTTATATATRTTLRKISPLVARSMGIHLHSQCHTIMSSSMAASGVRCGSVLCGMNATRSRSSGYFGVRCKTSKSSPHSSHNEGSGALRLHANNNNADANNNNHNNHDSIGMYNTAPLSSQSQLPRKPKKKQRRKSSILPTLDASPLLDKTAYIKKSALPGGTVSISGADGAKRLLRGQNQIRDWVGRFTAAEDGERESCSFALVGHGVPMQLLQSCVDSAWETLNFDVDCVDVGQGDGDDNGDDIGHGDGAGSSMDIEECFFRSSEKGNSSLDFDYMRIRTKDGTHISTAWPPTRRNVNNSNNSNTNIEIDDATTEYDEKANDIHDQLRLYLTVMMRIASTFAGLAEPTTNDGGDTDDGTSGTLHLSKRLSWKTEILKGFVYPPSATIFSTAFWNDGEDCSSGDHIADLTSPPIVELDCYHPIANNNSRNEGYECNEEGGKRSMTVRITLQGIPSSGGMENDHVHSAHDDSCGAVMAGVPGGRGMVPVSLVFEACFGIE